MTSTLIFLLGMAAIIIGVRLATWHGLRLVSHTFDRSVSALKRARTWEGVLQRGRTLRTRFPKSASVVEARLRPDRFAGLPLTLMVVAALYTAALLGGLVEELLEADELVAIDEGINQGLASLRTAALVTMFTWITDLGGSSALTAVALVTTGLLWARGHGRLITPLWLTILGSQLSTYAGKYVLARPRPEFLTEVLALTPSFPSGHATGAAAVYGFIAYIIARELRTGPQRFEIVFWACVLIGLIGFSRLFLSVHYASDVVAGFMVGGFWLLVGFALAELTHHSAPP